MALSRWADTQAETIDTILDNMLNYSEWHEAEKDPLTNENLSFQIEKFFSKNQIVNLNETEISYNLINYEYEKVRPGAEKEEMRSNRIQSISGFILIYTDGTQVQYITDRSGNSSTLTILRKINNYEGQLEIKKAPFNITEDLFTWMIFRVMNDSIESLEEESHLLIKKIIGFKGSTRDRLAEIAGTGNRILNQLSTLAFLFENKRVSYIKNKIEYEREQIEFSIDLNGNVDIDFETYTGNYILTDYEQMTSTVTLMVFLEIIPKIITNYYLDIENKYWSENIKVNFFTSIGESISNQISKKMDESKTIL